MDVKVKMPGGGDERLDPTTIFVLREPSDFEREESPQAQSIILGPGVRLYPVEPVAVLLKKFDMVRFARLTSPGGKTTLVNADRVTDRDERSPVLDHENTNSVLCFGPGPLAPRVRVRETLEDLMVIWQKLEIPAEPLA